jgi:putative ABC transport system permease protein
VGSFTLVAGVIGVSNIMLVIVKERTREIGIRRAIGASPLAVVGQIVMESVILTTAAGYAGLVAGILALEAVGNILKRTGAKTEMFRNPEVDLTIALIALGILVLCGAIAGLIPGTRALSMKPVEAIRMK